MHRVFGSAEGLSNEIEDRKEGFFSSLGCIKIANFYLPSQAEEIETAKGI
jgi:hypothetical protein